PRRAVNRSGGGHSLSRPSPKEGSVIEGVKIRLGGKFYIVPAMNNGGFRATRKDREFLRDSLDPESQDITDEQLDAVHRVIYAGLRRNYPELKIEDLYELVDNRNMMALLQAVGGQGGELVYPEGEAEPQRPAIPTGDTSTA